MQDCLLPYHHAVFFTDFHDVHPPISKPLFGLHFRGFSVPSKLMLKLATPRKCIGVLNSFGNDRWGLRTRIPASGPPGAGTRDDFQGYMSRFLARFEWNGKQSRGTTPVLRSVLRWIKTSGEGLPLFWWKRVSTGILTVRSSLVFILGRFTLLLCCF